MKATTVKTTCLIPDCDNAPKTRGLCCSHYTYIGRLIAKKKSPSFEVLERRGKVLPCKKRGSRNSNVQNWLNAK